MAFAAALMDARPRLVSFARSLCRDAERAEDLASDTVAKAWAARRSFEPGSNLAAWLSTILRNCFLTEQRRKRWDGGYVEDLGPVTIPSPATQEDHVHLLDLNDALMLLERGQREAVIAVALEGDYEQAAISLDVAVGTIKSRVGRGRRALQEMSQ